MESDGLPELRRWSWEHGKTKAARIHRTSTRELHRETASEICRESICILSFQLSTDPQCIRPKTEPPERRKKNNSQSSLRGRIAHVPTSRKPPNLRGSG